MRPLETKHSLPGPATRAATHTCRTSCGSAVPGSPSTMFSTASAKTVPFASDAMQLGGSEGSTMTTGPARSLGASAETQVSSSSMGRFAVEEGGGSPAEAGTSVGGVAVEEENGERLAFLSSSLSLRFLLDLGFLSPLKVRGVGMVGRGGAGQEW